MVRCTCNSGVAFPMPDGNHIYCDKCEQGKTLAAKAEECKSGPPAEGQGFDWSSVLPSGMAQDPDSYTVHGSGIIKVPQPTGVVHLRQDSKMQHKFTNNSSERVLVQITSPGKYTVRGDFIIPYMMNYDLGDTLLLDPGQWYEREY